MSKQTKTEDALGETEKVTNTTENIHACTICGEVGHDLEFDEYLNGYVCCKCDMEREIGGI